MSEKMVVLATYTTSINAHMARNRLEEEGVRSVIEGEPSTGAFAGLGGAFSTVKLLVLEEDVERALEILEGDTSGSEEGVDSPPPQEGESDEIDDEDPDYLASRAVRGSIFSFFFFPLALISLWLVMKFIKQEKEATPEQTRQLYIALTLNLFGVVVSALILVGFIAWVASLF